MYNFVVLLSLVVLLAYYYIKRTYSYWSNRNIPTLKASFPFGNVRGISTEIHSSKLLQKFYNQLKGQGVFGGLYFFMKPVALVLDLELVKNILVKDFAQFHERGLYHNAEDDPLSVTLLTMNDPSWKYIRARVSPTFTSGKMKMMLPAIMELGEKFTDILAKAAAECNDIEIIDAVSRFTIDTIGTTAFGLDCNSLEDPGAKFTTLGRKATASSRYKGIIGQLILIYRDLARKLHIKVTHDDVSEFFVKVVKDTVKYREDNNIQRNDFLDILMKLKNEGFVDDDDETKTVTYQSLNEITANAITFFVGGFETASKSIAYALHEMSLNVEIQDKARQCVNDTLKKYNNEFTYDALMEMTYIEQCLMESMRKYPPIPTLFRMAKTDYPVPGTKDVIERGTLVLIPTYGIQHDPEIYPKPDEYNPDRFATDLATKRSSYTFLPFGKGPRACVGERFCMMQVRYGLALLLKNFRFSPSKLSKGPLKLSIPIFILTPESSMYLHVEKL